MKNALLHEAQILWYVKGTIDYGLVYKKKSEDHKLAGYCNADYVGCHDNWRSNTEFVLNLGLGTTS